MKKVLILAYDFPPYVSVGGLRPFSWFNYLSENGLYPVVVTRQWSNKHGNYLDYVSPGFSKEVVVEESNTGTILRSPYKPNLANRLLLKYGEKRFNFLRKLVTLYYELIQFLFFTGTKSKLFYAADSYLKKNKVDLIIATGTPHILFKYASKLSSNYDIPWVADYRDPWSQSRSRNTNWFLKKWNPFFEKKFLKNVSEITTVSPLFEEKIKELIKDKKISIVTNGFDPEAMEKVKNIDQQSEKLKIAHVGTIYFYHPIEKFLSAVNSFYESKLNIDFEINFYGLSKENELTDLIEKKFPLLKKVVFVHPKLSNLDLLKVISKHNILLLFNNYAKIGTKIYDYIALKRLVLFCFSEESVEKVTEYPYYIESDDHKYNPQIELLLKTNSGLIIKNSKDLVENLHKLHDEFKSKGEISCNSVNIDEFSRKNQARILADRMKSIISTHQSK
ncbi:MAG: hypothetical protein EA412_05695 [Chitinophagaceae bacterium]|nr:MAG: hypothetical protein EA412_05695 [Chitinophagaceae bacterium]